MSLGEIWWFLNEIDQNTFVPPLNAIINAGLSALNPIGVRHSINDEGVQVPWNESDLLEEWRASRSVTAQLWVSQEADVLVTVDPALKLLILDVDGVTYLEARRIVFCTLDAALTTPDTKALILDRSLPDRGEEWLRFLQEQAAAPPYRADMLVTSMPSRGQFELSVKPTSWLRTAKS